MATRVLIVDDDGVFRGLLKRLLGESVNVVAEAADGEEAVRLAEERQPELVLMDIGLPVLDGIEATRRIKAASGSTKVLLLTSLNEEAYLSATGKSGADALLPKQRVRAELVATLRSIHPHFGRYWDGRERRLRQDTPWNGTERRGRRPRGGPRAA